MLLSLLLLAMYSPSCGDETCVTLATLRQYWGGLLIIAILFAVMWISLQRTRAKEHGSAIAGCLQISFMNGWCSMSIALRCRYDAQSYWGPAYHMASRVHRAYDQGGRVQVLGC